MRGRGARAPQAIAREIQDLIEGEFGGGNRRGETDMIVRKNMAELEKMRAAGLLVWKILDTLKEHGARGRDHVRVWK